ncbi:hypothetical protein [Nocardia noduli]|uniref:hypothetical protein n=1 Tax=Nocardia noduli TaxID=2815722 RepID=UPI001C214726|nr:hypothetical protein [Nocardia noduli]
MTLHVESAQLPANSGDDRLVLTPHSVIVLDGATAHDPTMPCASDYVDELGIQLSRTVDSTAPLPHVLHEAIATTAQALRLKPGYAPSSTVAIVRTLPHTVESLVLGDSSVIVGYRSGRVSITTDERLSQLGLPDATRYTERLATGCGYDDTHHIILKSLQAHERAHRNQPGGYWIAEADPQAACHSFTSTYDREELAWIILATDGVSDLQTAVDFDWPGIATFPSADLAVLLARIHAWEADSDPDGRTQPRAKRHDDKTVAVLKL